MPAYHQIGHNSENLLAEADLSGFAGAVLSPTNYTEEEIALQVAEYQSDSFKCIFDPQLYYPRSERGKLSDWTYFPDTVDTADLSDLSWWSVVLSELADTVERLGVRAVCSPITVPGTYSSGYYAFCGDLAAEFEQILDDEVELYQTVFVNMEFLEIAQRSFEIASLITRRAPKNIYLVFNMALEQGRKEYRDNRTLTAAMNLVKMLSEAGIRVHVAYVSTELILWKHAGAADCSTGKFFNLRNFSAQRWAPQTGGGGQKPYWVEESLLAHLQADDVARLDALGLLESRGVSVNPYGQSILNNISSGDAWLGLSWRYFLYWFIDFEQRFESGHIDAEHFLGEVDKAWEEAVDNNGVLMVDRRNDGTWVRHWRIAVRAVI